MTPWLNQLSKDTVLIAFLVLRWARHVEQDQLWILGFLDHNAIQLHSCVHPPHVGLVSRLYHRHSFKTSVILPFLAEGCYSVVINLQETQWGWLGESDGLIQTHESCINVIVHPEAHANWTCDLYSRKHASTLSDYSHFLHRKSSGTCKQKVNDKMTYRFSHSLEEGKKI